MYTKVGIHLRKTKKPPGFHQRVFSKNNKILIFYTIQFLTSVTKSTTLMNTDLISIGKEKKIQTGGQTNIKANIIMSLTPLPVQASPPRHSSFR